MRDAAIPLCAALFALSACAFNVADIPVQPDAARPDDAGHPDATARDAGADAGQPVPVRNRLCKQPLPASLPAPPAVSVTSAGRPTFDTYHDIPCGALNAFSTCHIDAECPGSACLHDVGRTGVCRAQLDDDRRTVISLDDGACLSVASVQAHAKACCSELAGFECRRWPYPNDAKPGELCSRHEDCAIGLLCKQGPGNLLGFGTFAQTYGVCLCPEVAPDSLRGCP